MMAHREFLERHRTYAEVDLAAIRHNGSVVRKLFADQLILSVLKADAYGHGITGVLPAYETFTDWYAVATAEEAMEIRNISTKPVLLFGPAPKEQIIPLARLGITFTVGSAEYAQQLSGLLADAGITAQCHLKIDTGLNRSGIRWRTGNDALAVIRQIRQLPQLRFTGTYTHLACPEGDQLWEIEHTKLQMQRFLEACHGMTAAGLSLGIRHCCATGGALVNPAYRMDMVRLGMLPMGMSYTDESVRTLGLQPALTWISRLAQIETLEPGEPVSYGCTFRSDTKRRIGIVTCGYADGYRRVYSNKSHVLIGGKKVPVIGRVAMDYTMVDLTGIPDAYIGMEVILLGSDGVNSVTALELSAYGESVSGEVTCVISPRVPRIYKNTEDEQYV